MLAAIGVAISCLLACISRDIQSTAFRWLSLGASPESTDHIVLLHSHLPRMYAAFVVGAGLSCVGVTYQGLLRNPLASPYTLGIASAAALGGLMGTWIPAIGLGFSLASPIAFAIVGALVGSAFIGVLAMRQAAWNPTTLVLAGVVIALLCSSVITLLQFLAGLRDLSKMTRWLMGSLDWVPATTTTMVAAIVCVSCGIIYRQAKALNAISGGNDWASGLGFDTTKTTKILLATTAICIGALVGLAGPIAFVGLVIPHLCRSLVGPDHQKLFPIAIVFGGLFLAVCDNIARLLTLAGVPVGLVTAAVGAPFFLTILLKNHKHNWS